MTLDKRFGDAVVYAAHAHRDQKRKSSEVPYVGHLLAVASIVIDYGGDEDESIAALLHDAPEDQGGLARLADIRTRFGARVASIVEACSDSLVDDPNNKDSWPVRKRAYLHHLAQNTDASVYLVSAADKLHNVRSMLADYFIVGEALWGRFSRDAGKVGTIRNYRSLVASYQRFDEPRVARIAHALKRALAELEVVCAAGADRQLSDGRGLIATGL